MIRKWNQYLSVFHLIIMHTWKPFLLVNCLTLGIQITFTYLYAESKLIFHNQNTNTNFLHMVETVFFIPFVACFLAVVLLMILPFFKKSLNIKEGLLLRRLPTAPKAFLIFQFLHNFFLMFLFWALQLACFLACLAFYVKLKNANELYNLFFILNSSDRLMHLFPLTNPGSVIMGILLLVNMVLLTLMIYYSDRSAFITGLILGILLLIFYANLVIFCYLDLLQVLFIAYELFVTIILFYKLYTNLQEV